MQPTHKRIFMKLIIPKDLLKLFILFSIEYSCMTIYLKKMEVGFFVLNFLSFQLHIVITS